MAETPKTIYVTHDELADRIIRAGKNLIELGLALRVGRDHLSEPITMRKGLTGVKPAAFNSWVLNLLGWIPSDDFTDLFPGSGGMSEVVATRRDIPLDGQLDWLLAPVTSEGDKK